MGTTEGERAAAERAIDDSRTSKVESIGQAGEHRSTRLESLRALGWLAVFVGHTLGAAYPTAGLAEAYPTRIVLGSAVLALYLFLGMSGYLLYLPFARQQLVEGRKVDVAKYARNRMLRILPLYYVVIVVLLIVQPLDADRGDWWRWATFTQNFSVDTIHRINAPLWTVVVEVQFYIALPFLAWAIAKLGGRSFRRTVAILATLGIASSALRLHEVVLATEPNITGVLGKYTLPSLLYAFIGGMLLAVGRLAWERRPPRWAAWPIVGDSGVWIAAGVALSAALSYDFERQEPWVAVAAALIVGACVLPLRADWLVGLLEWRPLGALGLTSFSLYLWHWPILQRLSGTHFGGAAGQGAGIIGGTTDFTLLLVTGLPLCVAVGIASYWLIERPFLRRRRGWGATASTPPADAHAPAPTPADAPAPAPTGAG